MSTDNRFAVWRNPITELWVPAGSKGHRRVFIVKGPEFAAPEADWHTFPLDLDDFTFGQSDWDVASDEAYCPCGQTIRDWGSSAGDLLRSIYKHCGEYGHPRPRFER